LLSPVLGMLIWPRIQPLSGDCVRQRHFRFVVR
jgi:hypothetical protein